jgi:hypothetical protein
LAFLVAPAGFVLSLIGLITAGRRNQRGKGLAVAGLIVSLVVMIGTGVFIFTVANKVETLTDPGCTVGKAAILDNESKLSSASTAKEGLQATANGLDSAVTKANHDNVRSAVKALSDDYHQLLSALNSGTAPPNSLQSKMEADGTAFDALCSIGTSK